LTASAWTNKLITAKDHASIQLNIGHLNDEGIYTGAATTFALAGKVRAQVRLCWAAVEGVWQAGHGQACSERRAITAARRASGGGSGSKQ
jgi:small subunit ribosomal protein S21e